MVEDSQILAQMESVLETEWTLYNQLIPFSETQLQLLGDSQPDAERIAQLMEKKVDIIGSIRHLEEEHGKVRQEWENAYSLISEEDKHGIQIWKERLTGTIERLKSMEDEIADGIRRCESEVSKELQKIYKERNVNRAYFRLEKRPPIYIDKRK